MEHRHKEWGELRARAMYLLEHPRLLPEQKGLGRFYLALRLWHYPAFAPYTAWLIYRAGRDERPCLLREVVWDRPDEAERMLDPLQGLKRGFHTPPTLAIKTVELAREEVDSRLAELQRIVLPVFMHSNTLGLDGETFGIAVGTGFLAAQVSWWCNGPPEWQEAVAWFNQTRAYLSAQLEGSPARHYKVELGP